MAERSKPSLKVNFRRQSDRRWLVVAVLASAYFFAHFHRIAPAILSSELRSAFQLNAMQLGFLSSIYFYLYAGLQIPSGALSDVLGPRKVITFLTFLAFVGSILFGLARDFNMAILARILVGAGVAGVYVPALKVFSQWGDNYDFAVLTGVMIAAGNIGGLAATSPLGYFAGIAGWRFVFVVIGMISLVIAAICWFVLDGDITSGRDVVPEKGASGWCLLRDPQLVKLGLCLLGKYGPLMSFLGAWGCMYLEQVHKLTVPQAGNILMTVSIGYAVGSPLFGFLSDYGKWSRKTILVISTFIFTISWLPFLFWPGRIAPLALVAITAVMGLSGGGSGTLVFSVAKESFPGNQSGAALAIINTMTFLGVPVFQPLTGYLIDRAGGAIAGVATTAAGFRAAFFVCLSGCIIAVLAAQVTRDTGASHKHAIVAPAGLRQ